VTLACSKSIQSESNKTGDVVTETVTITVFKSKTLFIYFMKMSQKITLNLNTSLFSLYAPSSDAPVYIEQKSNKPSNTGLQAQITCMSIMHFL